MEVNNYGISRGRGLQLNQEILQQLLEVRTQIEKVLKQIETRYRNNQVHLTNLLFTGRYQSAGVGKRGAYLRGSTFYFKGNMFFKDAKYRNCPDNSDYDGRRVNQREIFPMDWELSGRHIWSMVDKMAIVQGIKEQISDFLGMLDKKSNKQRQISLHSEKLVNLLPKIENTSFTVDWHEISAHFLRHRHSPSSCQAMWQLYLHPKLRRSSWSEDENHRLIRAVNNCGLENWLEIARNVGHRSDYQCFIQYFAKLHGLQPNRWSRWQKSDDERLLRCITKHTLNGVINWNIVSSYFPQKSKKTLQGRYAYSINPNISHVPFSNEEDVLLLAAVKEYGTKFNSIPRQIFPHRSLAQLRSRYYNVLINRHKQHPWTIEDDQELLKFVAQNGTSEWLESSQTLSGRHSRTSCRTRFLTIKRYFERNPKATLNELPRLKAKRMSKNKSINTLNWEEKIVGMQLEQLE